MAVVKQLWICINTEVEEVKSKFSVIWAFFILICSHDTKSIATRNPHISNISQRLQAFNSLYSSWWWHWNDDITLKYTHVLNFCFGGQGKKGKQDDLLCNVLVDHMLTGLEIKWGEKWGKHEELSKGGKVIPAYIVLILSAITLIASFSPCSQSPLLPPSHFCPAEVCTATTITDFALGDLLWHQLSAGEVFKAPDFGSPLQNLKWPLSFSVSEHCVS